MPSILDHLELQTLQPENISRADGLRDQSPTNQVGELSAPTAATITAQDVRKSRAVIVILQLTAVTFLTSVSSGLITVSIPRIAEDLAIQTQLYYW